LVARHCEVQMTGVPLVEGYGLTETAPVAIANPVTIEEWSGEIGVPLPSTDAAILDDDGRPVALGEVGEICLRGPQVMKGYWNRPEETARVFTDDGWRRNPAWPRPRPSACPTRAPAKRSRRWCCARTRP